MNYRLVGMCDRSMKLSGIHCLRKIVCEVSQEPNKTKLDRITFVTTQIHSQLNFDIVCVRFSLYICMAICVATISIFICAIMSHRAINELNLFRKMENLLRERRTHRIGTFSCKIISVPVARLSILI